MSVNSKIFKNTAAVTLIGVLAQFVGFVIPILIANYFGANSEVDAYYFSIAIPTTIVGMIIGGAIKIIFIPQYIKQKNENPEVMPEFLGQFFLLLMLFSIGITIFLVFYVRLIGLDFLADQATKYHSEIFLLTSSPIIILSVLFQFINAIYNANQKFLVIEFAAVLKFGFVILMIYEFHEKYGLFSAIIGHIIGQVISLVVALIALKTASLPLNMKFKFNIGLVHLLKSSALAFGAFVFAQSTPVIQKVIAGLLEVGNLSILGYAERLSVVPSFIIGSSFGIILTTFWSSLRLTNKKELEDSFNKSLATMVLIMIPLSIGGIFLSDLIVQVVFERGKFNNAVSTTTAIIFSYFLLQIIPSQIQTILSRVLHVYQDMKYLFFFSLFALIVNTILMYVLSIYLEFGLVGLPLGLFISRTILTICNIIYINKNYVAFDVAGQVRKGMKVFLASICMLGSLVLIRKIIEFEVSSLVILTINLIVGVLVYSATIWLLRHKEFFLLSKIIFGKVLNRYK